MARRASTGAGGPTNAGRRFPAEVLGPEEVLALLARCDGDRPSGLRNRALIALHYRAGLRISEALALLPKDVDAGAGSVRVLRGKGGHARTVGIDPGGLAIVDEKVVGSNPITPIPRADFIGPFLLVQRRLSTGNHATAQNSVADRPNTLSR